MEATARERLKELFAAAAAVPAGDRARYLDDACGADAALRSELDTLLASSDAAGDFLERRAGTDARAALAPFLTPVEPIEPLHQLGPYQILSEIGAGGMGRVYRARDLRLDRVVALKVLPPAAARDVEARRRFELEARAIAKLNHPHICALYDVGTHEPASGQAIEFLVMEYLDGQTLAQHLESGPLAADEMLGRAIEIADALDRAHRLGVIHRDLKPSNIILTEGGAKLLDFGIAKLLGRPVEADGDAPSTWDLTLTQRGRVPGTAAYMSPEQVRGESIDTRSDLFSFGAVLYEMITGQRPFAGANAEAVCEAILNEAPPIAEAFRDAPPGLAGVVRKTLETDRDRRYQRAAEIKTDLQRIEQARRAPGSMDEAASLVRRRTGASRLAAAAVLGVIAATGGYLALRGRDATTAGPRAQRSVAVLPFKPLAASAPEDDYIGLALAEALITELGAFKTMTVRPLSASSRIGTERDPVEAGRQLGADLVVDGAIQRTADRLRVNVSLVRVADRVAVWTDRFDAPWTDVFRVQDAVAEQVARALAAALSGEGRERVARRRTDDVAAYEAYLKGRYFWNMRTTDGLQKALSYFQQAIDRDKAYAPAYAGLADTYAMLGSMPYAVMPASEASSKAKAAARQALALDDSLAEAHVSLAFVTYAFDWDWRAGERGFKRAIALDPTYTTAHIWYALYLGQVGRVDEAVAEAQRSWELEPLSLIGTYSVGLAHYFARRYDAAAEYARKALEIDANFPSGRRLLGQVYAAQGRSAEALEEFVRLNANGRENWLHLALLAQAYGRAGEPAKARAILGRMVDASRTRFVPGAQIAMGYVGLADRDAAFTWLERAFVERSQALDFVKMDPMFDSLRQDARYADLVRRVGLAP
jgi:eukaryotic-like serine/threonine-protein kinase